MLHCSMFICFAILLQAVFAKQPNIVFILADDFGWNDVGYHGSEIDTPNLDKLAANGIKLNNYYVQPICSPSRSQLMSGRYQIHTGLQHGVIQSIQPNGLPLTLPTLADCLKQQQYSTHIVGKWHLGFFKKAYTPNHRGFDSFYGYLCGSEGYYNHSHDIQVHINGTKRYMRGLDFRHNMDVVTDQNGSYSTHIFAQRAIKLVTEHALYNKDKPLFLYLPFQSVHSPLEVPEHYEKKYSSIKNKARRIYAGMVLAMDEAIGKVVKAYEDVGLWDNTILIFSTDNGGQVLQGGNNWPLRGWKDQLWEGGIRGVGFVHSTLLKNKATVYDGLVHISDWYPTLVHLAGGSTEHLQLDGYDVWKAISETLPSPRTELLHNIDPLHPLKGERLMNSSFDTRVRAAIRSDDWKLLTGNPGPGKWIPALHHENSKSGRDLKQHKFSKNLWLFNISNDPEEKRDVSSQHPDIVHYLLERLHDYNRTAVPVSYPPFDLESDPELHGGVWGPWKD